jgi:uncharacterized protein
MIGSQTPCTAFEGKRCIATGALLNVALAAKNAIDAAAQNPLAAPVLIFNDATSEVVELDWRGSVVEFQARLALITASDSTAPDSAMPAAESTPSQDELPSTTKGPGRPKLGVVPREVTLLPRHWEWLATQTGGASVALRKLVEVARKESELKDRVRLASAVSYKFMSTMAGHEVGFEEASRALFAQDREAFEYITQNWPKDIVAHLEKLNLDVFTW